MASQASGAAPASSATTAASGASDSPATQPPNFGNNAPGTAAPRPPFSYGALHPSASGNAQFQQPPSASPAGSGNQLQQPLASPLGPAFSYNIPQQGAVFPRNQQFQSNMNVSAVVAQGSTTMPTFSHPVPFHPHTSQTSTLPPSSAPNQGPATSWVSSAPTFSVPPRMPGIPGMPAPPGLVASAPTSSNLMASSSSTESPSSVVLRPSGLTAIQSNHDVQQQIYPQNPSLPSMPPFNPGPWLQPPQLGGVPRPLYQPYPSAFPGPYPMPAHGVQLRPSPLTDSQPPAATPLGSVGELHMPSSSSGHQLASSSSMETEVTPPGTENGKHRTKDEAAVSEPLDSWTAHKTDTGIVYYYNALTGESTYTKPPGLKGEVDKVTAAPTSVSVENLANTDWALVTTNDGKKFYYNNKTKSSSWQMPSEVAELRKQQEDHALKEHNVPMPNANVLAEKRTAVSLNAPALDSGGREATALRTSNLPGSSSALDLIKKKLQDSGSPDISSSAPSLSGTTSAEFNGSRLAEATVKGLHSENSKDKLKDADGDGNLSDSSTDSEDADRGPTKEECIIQFKEMLKERGVAPFSKWEKELPKIVFDPRFKAIPSYSARRALFERYVKTRAEEERKEKRAAQKAAIERFKQLLDEATEDIDQNTNYQTFRKKWGNDPRFEVLDRKDRELLLNERVLPLKRAAEEKIHAERTALADGFKSMLKEKDVNVNSRWSRVKDGLRNDPRYKIVKHEDREVLFNEYVAQLKAADEEAEREVKVKKDEQEKLKERERELRKRKEREEHEMERVRLKIRRKDAVSSFQALLVETIKDPQASWTESKPKLEKDPQGRATNPDLDPSDTEKLFREHVKMLYERCVNEFRALLLDVLTKEAAAQETEDGKTVLSSWSTAKRLLKSDPRYNKMPRKDREALWRRYAEDTLRKQKDDKHGDAKNRHSVDSGRFNSGSRKTNERR